MVVVSAFLQKCTPYCVKTVTVLTGFLPQQSMNTVLNLDPLCQDGQGETLHRLKLRFICELQYKMNTHISCEKTCCQLHYFIPPPKKKGNNMVDLWYTTQQWLEQSVAVGTGSFIYASFSTYTHLIFWLCVICYSLYKYKHLNTSHNT